MNDEKEERARQSRRFIILVMFMFLISIVVFVVGTYFFVVPRLISLNLEVASLRDQLSVQHAQPETPALDPERPLTPKEVSRRLEEERLALQECADKHLNGKKEVSVVIDLEVASSGKVQKASIRPEKLGKSPFGNCLERQFVGLAFHRVPNDLTKISVPLSLKRTN
jgi:hypothetical protein